MLEKFDIAVDIEKETVKVTITKELMKDPLMPKNIPIDMIFFMFWTSSALGDRMSYINVVQTVTLASHIDVRMNHGLTDD